MGFTDKTAIAHGSDTVIYIYVIMRHYFNLFNLNALTYAELVSSEYAKLTLFK